MLVGQAPSCFLSASSHLVSSKSQFDLVHCDIWGPVRVPSVSGHRYYIVFINNYSCAFWIYLLKDCNRILDVIKNFFNEIINHFSVTPKCLRTDNVLEFVQSGIQSYCASLGVIHQTICPYTS